MTCPLCQGHDCPEFARSTRRTFYRCAACGLVSVPAEQVLPLEDEKKRYDLHQNSPDDAGYEAYLSRLFKPVLARISPGSRGLDFGCGPEPVLANLFRKAGHSMATYDLFYQADAAVLDTRYDFITATEVVEHLRDPAHELDRLWRCLKPAGILGIMTQWIVPQNAFHQWHYKNDWTHIRFYSPETFAWLGR